MDPFSDNRLIDAIQSVLDAPDHFVNIANLPAAELQRLHLHNQNAKLAQIENAMSLLETNKFQLMFEIRRIGLQMANVVERPKKDLVDESTRFERVQLANAYFGTINENGSKTIQDPFHNSYSGPTDGISRSSTFDELFAHSQSRLTSLRNPAERKRKSVEAASPVGPKRQG